ncbi:MAG: hypothetical protein Q9181_002048 [Wetmoreana brouardii]
MPEWVKEGEEPDARVRDEGAGVGRDGGLGLAGEKPAGEALDVAVRREREEKGKGKMKVVEKSLEDWLGEEEGSEETEEESEEEGSSEYEEVTDSEEEDDDGEAEKRGLVEK